MLLETVNESNGVITAIITIITVLVGAGGQKLYEKYLKQRSEKNKQKHDIEKMQINIETKDEERLHQLNEVITKNKIDMDHKLIMAILTNNNETVSWIRELFNKKFDELSLKLQEQLQLSKNSYAQIDNHNKFISSFKDKITKSVDELKHSNDKNFMEIKSIVKDMVEAELKQLREFYLYKEKIINKDVS